MDARKAIALLIWFWASHVVAGDYLVVLVSGETYRCTAKYVIDEDSLVHFTLTTGPEIAVPKDKVAWYETAVANGETPPPGSKPMKRPKAVQPGGGEWKLPKVSLSTPDLKSDLKALFQDGVRANVLRQFGVVTWLVVVLTTVLLYFSSSFLLWSILNLLGEPHPFFKLLGVNALLFLCAGVIFFAAGFSPVDPIDTTLIAAFFNLAISAALLIMILDCEVTAGVMGILIYQIVMGLFGFGLWKTVRFWIG